MAALNGKTVSLTRTSAGKVAMDGRLVSQMMIKSSRFNPGENPKTLQRYCWNRTLGPLWCFFPHHSYGENQAPLRR